MREIKFRAWHKEKKYMKYDDIYPDGKRDWAGWEQSFDCMIHVMQMDFELMQFTGLKDKNGKEIYEGDILIDEIERIFVIISMLGGLSVLPVKYYHDKIGNELIAQPTNDSQVYSALCNFKIIGNIYQNPELLEKP